VWNPNFPKPRLSEDKEVKECQKNMCAVNAVMSANQRLIMKRSLIKSVLLINFLVLPFHGHSITLYERQKNIKAARNAAALK
jgi:hypothetical protein